MTPHRHLVAVWNPSYALDALDLHAQLLLDRARASAGAVTNEDDVYVWWGKVRSANRQQPLPHLARILELDSEIEHRDEVQLYLTDYRSLYVAHVGRIAEANMSAEDPAHTPSYYRDDDLNCDFWFQLWDIRALVIDDTVAVQHELRQLCVTDYNDRPVSLYGGMVNLPLIVSRPDDARFFGDEERELLNDGRLWVEADAERYGLGGLMADLRDNVISDRVWLALAPQARTFLATGERLMRDHRRDATFDFSAVLVELAKAVEVQANATLAAGMQGAPASILHANVEGRIVDLTRHRALSLGQLSKVIAGDRERMDWLAKELENGRWFVESLPPILEDLARYRNRAAHLGRADREEVVALRASIVGIGCSGSLASLAAVKPRLRHGAWKTSSAH